METIRDIFRIGHGPSSSHTMGPSTAAQHFLERNPAAVRYRVTLFSSLAATGRGHMTDQALQQVFAPHPFELVWRPEESLPLHPNALRFEAFAADDNTLDSWEVYSVGGGALHDASGREPVITIYSQSSMNELLTRAEQTGEALWEMVLTHEDPEIFSYLDNVWTAMRSAIDCGLGAVGVLPGGLGLARKAHSFHRKSGLYGDDLKNRALIWSYALAVSEENAAGAVIVTAPTCGSSGVLPAVLHYLQQNLSCSHDDILRALATAGLVGNLVKQNASISGAEVGCQGEIGTACAMAAAAATQLHGGTVRQIEYAAEMGLEHHLGLTCDPVNGLVQIPCIERNAHAATRALSCCHFALLSGGDHKISFDEITHVMKETGQALPPLYRETAGGGIAKAYRQRAVTSDG